MQRILTINIIIVLSFYLGLTNLATGQISKAGEPLIVGAEDNETSKANLDLIAERAGNDKLIIMIGRLGISEKSSVLNRKRLRTGREYLQRTKALPTERIVIAEGERVSGEGRIEVYMDNKLFMIFLFERNRNFAREP